MKKEYIVLISFIILIIVFCILCLVKDNKRKNNIENPYLVYSFYKENNLERYKNYKLNTNFDYKNTVLRVNIGLDRSFYTNTKEVNSFSKLILVNKYNYVSKSFKPSNLVKVLEYTKDNMYLNDECMQAYVKMARDAYLNGLNIRAISTYRTYEYQENLYNNYVLSDGVNKADTYSARPGFSEHHTGLAVDIDNIKTSYLNFSKTEEFNWMNENSYK